MAGYIGQVQIGDDAAVLVGSTLYGICSTSAGAAAKKVTPTENNSGKFINNNYDRLLQGTTVHIKFTEGNTVSTNATLQVGTVINAQDIVGDFTCSAGTIISFTLDENQKWVVNDNVDNDTQYTFSEGSTSGAFSVSVNGANPTSVTIHGLGNAAYQNVSTATISNNSGETEIVGAAAIYQYVQDQTGGLAGLTGSMHFRGVTTTDLTDTANVTTNTVIINSATFSAIEGDVVILNEQEYVWSGAEWILLGDEGSYALKSSTSSVINTVSFTANTTPSIDITTVTASKVTITSGAAASLETTAVSVPNVTQAGTPTTASVTGGILVITSGTATVLGTAISITAVESFTANSPTVVSATDVGIGSASNWNAGTAASFSSTTTSVVVPS